MKDLETVLREGNSTVNQKIKGDFVGKHVYCNVNSLIEPFINSYDIDNAPFTMDDIENFYTLPELQDTFISFMGGSEEERNEEIEEANTILDSIDDLIFHYEDSNSLNDEEINDFEKNILSFITPNSSKYDLSDLESLQELRNELDEQIDNLKDLETEPQEIFEWWAVSSFMYEKLQALGHPVLDAGSCYVWGRCTTGQAILLDYSISTICANMGILEGQERDWSKH